MVFEAAPSVLTGLDPEFEQPKPRATRSGARVAPLPRPVIPLELEDDTPPRTRSTGILIGIAVLVVLLAFGAWKWLGGNSSAKIPEPTSSSTVPAAMEAPPVEKEPIAKEAPAPSKKVVERDPDRDEEERTSTRSEKSEKSAKSEKKTTDETSVVESKPVKPAPPPEPDPADKKVDKVFLTSRPSGARVTLDGRSLGKTPLEVEIRGKASVSLSLEGYKPLEKELRLADVRGTVNFELQALSSGSAGSMGKLFLSSAPAGAEIVYQGKVIGKTPKMVELPAGNRTLILRSGALSHTVDLDLKEGQNPAFHVPL